MRCCRVEYVYRKWTISMSDQDLLQRSLAQLTTLNRKIEYYLAPVSNALRLLTETLQPVAEWMALHTVMAEVTERTGWLPYRTVPFETYLSDNGNDWMKIIEEATSCYENYEDTILQDIELQLSTYTVDEEARETLREAIQAHQTGLYRCSCRVLLPEIERVIREDWLDITGIATLSQRQIEEAINRQALEDFVLNSPRDLVLFKYLARHLFQWVSDRDTIKEDSVPNRHAALHAWTPYSSRRDSLNTIICTDYVFRLVSSLKERSTNTIRPRNRRSGCRSS